MRKSLAALAALAATGAAFAQSSVTLFGVVDAGVSYQSATARDAVTGLSSKQSQWSLANSGYNSSRIGFRGTEDLGGGWPRASGSRRPSATTTAPPASAPSAAARR